MRYLVKLETQQLVVVGSSENLPEAANRTIQYYLKLSKPKGNTVLFSWQLLFSGLFLCHVNVRLCVQEFKR